VPWTCQQMKQSYLIKRDKQLSLRLQGHEWNLPKDVGRVVSHNIVIELVSKGAEVFSHARDICICDVLLTKKLIWFSAG
jgi:hypothetical protein